MAEVSIGAQHHHHSYPIILFYHIVEILLFLINHFVFIGFFGLLSFFSWLLLARLINFYWFFFIINIIFTFRFWLFSNLWVLLGLILICIHHFLRSLSTICILISCWIPALPPVDLDALFDFFEIPTRYFYLFSHVKRMSAPLYFFLIHFLEKSLII